MSDVAPKLDANAPPRWTPLRAIDRRVIGVLVEKAKTTPDAYPMTLNALRSGCNQKNNRDPLMQVEIEDVEESLERLRALGAVGEVQGGGRVSKFRHYAYEWLGVEKLELAVMAELLLRGAQTEGELRARAARMDPIADLETLRGVLNSLQSKKLVISLTPAGRGHAVTHALYEPRELEKVRAAFSAIASSPRELDREPAEPAASPVRTTESAGSRAASRADVPAAASNEEVLELRAEIEALRQELAAVRKDLNDLWSQFR
ncbi:MAG TPA: DUF480 domain-containing protein [Pirellulales bacterium]|jgi:hypothetical protein